MGKKCISIHLSGRFKGDATVVNNAIFLHALKTFTNKFPVTSFQICKCT